MAKVKVFYFLGYDIVNDRMVESKRPATLDAIKKVNGTPNMAKGLEVPEEKLDAYGFYTGQVHGSDLKG